MPSTGVLFLVVLTLGLVLFGLLPLWWIWRGYPKRAGSVTAYSVAIEGSSRGGDIVYREGEHEHRFGWDLGGAGSVAATVYVPDEARWSELVPWAADRREDILERVARELKKQRAPGTRVEIGEDAIVFYER